MPDFSIITREMCASINGPMDTHVGGYRQENMFSERHWPTCTCPAYKFSKASINFGGRWVRPECKHIEQAQREACGWHQLYSEERLEEPGVCPRCGGPTVVVRVAV
jgi:hypothetical protein